MNQNQLTQKEKLLLQDLKSQEELCIKKYSKFANEVGDNVLKQLFQQLKQHEEQHLNTINQIMAGQTPVQSSGSQQNMQAQSQQGGQQQSWQGQSQGMQAGGQQQNWQAQQQGMQAGSQSQSGQSNQNFTPNSNFKSPNANQKDFDLVQDLLSTEKCFRNLQHCNLRVQQHTNQTSFESYSKGRTRTRRIAIQLSEAK